MVREAGFMRFLTTKLAEFGNKPKYSSIKFGNFSSVFPQNLFPALFSISFSDPPFIHVRPSDIILQVTESWFIFISNLFFFSLFRFKLNYYYY